MGHKFYDIKEEAPIVLSIHANEKHMDLGAVVKKHLSQNLTLISLNYNGTKRLVFDNVKIDALHCPEDAVPILWHNVKIINHKDAYLLQTNSDGTRSNRRNSYRVPIATLGWLTQIGKPPRQVMIKDVSMTGFAITDRKKELHLSAGDRVSLAFDDLIFQIKLEGKVVRIETHDQYIIYGFVILNICNDLPAYINLKQRKVRR
ncbi:MAG: PilZ domain-containing protein [Lachnospiraceae bacterium]|nr:PilZ domain-containing protein [Lachnospiraceae bacterium]